ncbi:MAG: amidase [Cyanobacteria bacterium P01_F01_bin.56]
MKFLTASAAIAQVIEHQISVSEILNRSLQRIYAREYEVKAWTFLAVEAAHRQMAIQAEYDRACSPADRLTQSPLLGIPVGIKDIFATVDMPTAWGLPLYRDRYLPTEATVVTRLKAAGAIILGKTVTTELATAAAGPTRNPHNLRHTPGGSSSGSAAAVADGMVPVAIGSQTMGSILRPAAYCGIFGFKPSFSRIDRHGVMPVSTDLDHVGIFARCLDDMQRVFEVLVDRQPTLPEPETSALSFSLTQPPRLAWVPTPDWSLIDPLVQERLQRIVQVLSPSATALTRVDLPTTDLDYWATTQTLCAYGLYQHHSGLLNNHRSVCSPQLQDWLQRGQAIDSSAYGTALRTQKQFQASMDTLLSEFDAILTPVTPGPAPRGLDNTGSPRFCSLWTLCGLPAITLPIGKTPGGLPLACQLVGRRNGDRQLLHLAQYCWEQVLSAVGGIVVPAQ